MIDIRLGDCIEVLKTLESASVDAIVTDPPYGIGDTQPSPDAIRAFLEGSNLDTGGDFMAKDWEIPSIAVWQECLRVAKPGAILATFSGSRTHDLFYAAALRAGWSYQGTTAWLYTSGMPHSHNVWRSLKSRGIDRPDLKPYGTGLKPAWEPVLVFSKGTPTYPMPKPITSPKANRREYTLGGLMENDHVSKKPLAVMQHFIAALSKPGDVVLDPYLGSGTTAHAAWCLDRGCIGIERDSSYFEIARKRIDLVWCGTDIP